MHTGRMLRAPGDLPSRCNGCNPAGRFGFETGTPSA